MTLPGMHPAALLAVSGVLVAVVAHGLVGISLVWDKVLLQRKGMQSLASYVFWLGAMSIIAVVLIPFGFHMPPLKTIALAFAAAFVDLAATYFYYDALKAGEASQELAAMGGFTPIATLLFSIPLLGARLEGQVAGFVLMTVGSFAMFIGEKLPLRQMLPRIVAAAVLFGLANVLQKIVFNEVGFISGFVCYAVGMFVAALTLLIPPAWRQQIVHPGQQPQAKNRISYFANRLVAGIGSFLVIMSISLTSPALVEAISGTRYVVVFLGAYAITRLRPRWFKEDFTTRALVIKTVGTGLVVAGLILAGLHGRHSGGGPS
jgi:drug/metabolite transporter (DMT)-like permease